MQGDKHAILFILVGLPFSGKSTLARALALRGVTRVAIDEINDERGFWNPERGLSDEQWSETYRIAYDHIESVLRSGGYVADDSPNFTRALRDRLRSIARNNGAETVLIYVNAGEETVRTRWLDNRVQPGRRDVRDSDFENVIQNFEVPAADEHAIEFDGTSAPDLWIPCNLHQLRGDSSCS